MSLKHLVPLKDYVPTIYTGVKEIDALIKSEESIFDVLISLIDQEYARIHIQTSDEIGVLRFEQLMGITADPTIESLEFRKQRLLTRSNATLPYSTIWLRVYLNSVIGEHNYELNIDYDNDIITLYGYLLDYSWAREAANVIKVIKPCQMIFVNVPTMIQSVGLLFWSDINTWDSATWDDKNTWFDYAYLTSDELVDYNKQPQSNSNFQALLNNIGNIKLNNTNLVQDLTITVKNDTIYIQFDVPENIKLLEFVEILDIRSQSLLSTNCYIDTPSGTNIVIRLSCYLRKET